MSFTTRPELSGTFGMVASTHWLASAAGMAVLERGGNAFDAAVAAGFALQVVEPHMNGPGGDLPLLLWDGSRVRVVCGQGPAPAAATIEAYRERGYDLVPGVGPYAACVPGAFDAWLTLLRDHGTWEFADVVAYAIGYARDGFPATSGIISAIARIDPAWNVSAAIWQVRGGRLRNPMLADTYEQLASVSGPSREERIDAVRDEWYRGWVAGKLAAGFLTTDDLAGYRAVVEEPASLRFGDWTVFKTGPWGQGPVLLQQLAVLDGVDLGPFLGDRHVHTVIEGAKLAFADRDAWYGDSAPVPLDRLLSREYAAERRALIGADASGELRPGGPSPRFPTVQVGAVGDAEPTRGDTCHLDVADRFGNLVSATPSGGWLQSSPAIDGLGFSLGTRAQMFWLEEGLASSLKPGVRPRTTLSPSMAVHDDGTVLAFGTPGGDQQDQWSLEFFLAHAVFGLPLQEAIDAPMFHTDHFPSSFHPREVAVRAVTAEGRMPRETVAALRARGHAVDVTGDWSQGRLSAISRAPDGLLRAGANARGMQGYAVGR
jgi:gamma-glutamyltranspeptidase/glutathione hydrolase